MIVLKIPYEFKGGPLDGDILPIFMDVTIINFKIDEISKDKFVYEKIESEFIYRGFIH